MTNDQPRYETEKLGQHTAEFDRERETLRITGQGTEITLSQAEVAVLLTKLYDLRDEIFRKDETR